MTVGLFSGSFNPIHLGHTRLAEHIRQAMHLDEVWLIVSPNNPLKEAGSLLDEQVRLKMVQLATEDMPGLRASDFEFALPKPNYTINTLRALNEAYPEHRFALIIGSDNMAIFDRWRDYQLILAEYTIIVYPRPGDDMQALQEKFPMMQVVKDAPLLDISATEIRQQLSNGNYESKWLNPKVNDFLQKNAFLFGDIKKK